MSTIYQQHEHTQ